MARNVMWVEPNEHDECVLVKLPEASARIEARRYYAYLRTKRPDIVLSDDQVLEELMLMHWAWFDEDGQ